MTAILVAMTAIPALVFVAMLIAGTVLRFTKTNCIDCGERVRLDDYLRCPACRFVAAHVDSDDAWLEDIEWDMARDLSWRQA